jgi:hypothetical protein
VSFLLGGKKMAKVREIIDRKTKEKLYKLTKNLLDQKDVSIVQAMQHDSYKRVGRRIRQVRWGK